MRSWLKPSEEKGRTSSGAYVVAARVLGAGDVDAVFHGTPAQQASLMGTTGSERRSTYRRHAAALRCARAWTDGAELYLGADAT